MMRLQFVNSNGVPSPPQQTINGTLMFWQKTVALYVLRNLWHRHFLLLFLIGRQSCAASLFTPTYICISTSLFMRSALGLSVDLILRMIHVVIIRQMMYSYCKLRSIKITSPNGKTRVHFLNVCSLLICFEDSSHSLHYLFITPRIFSIHTWEDLSVCHSSSCHFEESGWINAKKAYWSSLVVKCTVSLQQEARCF